MTLCIVICSKYLKLSTPRPQFLSVTQRYQGLRNLFSVRYYKKDTKRHGKAGPYSENPGFTFRSKKPALFTLWCFRERLHLI
jgi:hypothetical protein